jgi:hypothetical protein
MRVNKIVLMLTAVLLITSAGCKSSKKAREAAALKARQEQELALKNQRDAEAKAAEERLRTQEANRELEEKARRADEAAKAESAAPAQKVEQYFAAISSSTNVASANSSINEALGLFESEQTPVLIVISEQDGQKDYDKPTTIKNYLNYLKDQHKNINRVGSAQLNDKGKIKELELIKDR